MIIEIGECEATNGGQHLLQDLFEYEAVYAWVDAIMTGQATYIPLEFYIKLPETKKAVRLLSAGEDTGMWKSFSKRLARMPKKYWRTVSDDIEIKADIFECELYIHWI